MAIFDGLPMATAEPVDRLKNNPRAGQMTTFFGVGGMLKVDGGFRGRSGQVHGRIQADTPSDLAQIRSVWRSYQDGQIYLYICSDGAFQAELVDFEPTSRVEANVASGLYEQDVTWTLLTYD